MRSDAIAILGGTGAQGLGLALRFAKAGRPVVIGSRKLERAEAAILKQRRGAATPQDFDEATRTLETVREKLGRVPAPVIVEAAE